MDYYELEFTESAPTFEELEIMLSGSKWYAQRVNNKVTLWRY